MRILALIPARAGSKGIPNKNIKNLAGKPLLQYTIDVAQKSNRFDKIVVSSDSEEIMSLAKSLGASVPFMRPSNLAEDDSTSLSVVQHALEFFLRQGEVFDAVCLLQVTFPFRTVEDIDNALDKFSSEKPDALISVSRIPHPFNPHWAFKEDDNGLLKVATGEEVIISRRQDLPKAFYRNGSIYITRASVILKDNSLYGSRIAYIELPHKDIVNIDTIEDWNKAEDYLSIHKNFPKS